MITDSQLDFLHEETWRLVLMHGTSRKLDYHRHYLVQDAINKVHNHLTERSKSKSLASRALLTAVCSLMGQYNKIKNFKEKTDFNHAFIRFVKERERILRDDHRVPSIDQVLEKLLTYNNLWDRDKSKAILLLIDCSVGLLNTHRRENV